METKKCSKCGRELPVECFGKNKNSKDGLTYQCKECRHQYYSSNSDVIKQHRKEFYNDNKKKELERQKEYTTRNKDKISAYKKQYREEHREKLAAYIKQYMADNSEKYKAYQKEYNKSQIGRAQRQFQKYRRMDIRNGFGDVIDFDTKWIMDNIHTKSCVYCGKTGWDIIGCDRKDNSLPHTKANCVPCCTECNIRKGKMNYEDYLNKIRNNERHN